MSRPNQKYNVKFSDGNRYDVDSFNMASAVILAQTEQILKEKPFTDIVNVHEYESGLDYKPIYHFRAHPTVNKFKATEVTSG